MAEVQKTVEVPQETQPTEVTPVPAAIEVAAETKPAEETPVVAAETAAPVTEETPAEDAKPTETPAVEEAAQAEEDKKDEEVKPIEEGHLAHKAQGSSFPKNLIPSKEFFFFGTDAVEPKSLAAYQKAEKNAETVQSNIAWASETGKGLLFVGDKKTPSGVISLADATEPEVDGSNKFHFTSKGNKHTFKAANAAERDNWVAQLKLRIAGAKELATTIVESETYKQTVESFKPAKKEEVKEEAAKTEETPAVEGAATEVAAEEPAKEEESQEEVKTEEPKRRSASRKRTSFFGFGKKEEAKPTEDKSTEETAEAVAEAPLEAAAIPEVEAPTAEETPAADAAAPTAEEVKAEEKVESPKEKPAYTKRNSFFGSVFSKKEKKTPELKPTKDAEAPKEGEAAETAPVIPPVEATTPLAVDVSNPANVPTETTEVTVATPTEAKKEFKEKRKSSLPFAFGKRDKSPAPAEGEERSKSPFSKLRATIKGKKAEKPAEEAAKEEAVKEEEPIKEEAAEAKTEEAATEAPKEGEAKPDAEAENKPEAVATSSPAVTAAA